MFDKLGQLKDLWQLKNQMQEIKKRLDSMVIKASSPRHIFEVTISGSQEIKEVAVLAPYNDLSQEEIGRELTAVMNKAIRDSQSLAAQAMGANLPQA